MVANSDTAGFLYEQPESARNAPIEMQVDYRPSLWDLDKNIREQIKKKILVKTGISAWNEDDRNEVAGRDLEQELEEHVERERKQSSISQRIATLQRLGHEEDIVSSEESGVFLFEFFVKRKVKNKPFIFLLENGNYRALWKGDKGQQIGLQFLPDGKIQFVIFSPRPDSKDLSRSYGVDTPQGIDRMLEDSTLRDLLYS